MADDAPWIEPVVVPDDISSLQADIDAYHREERRARRHPLLRRLTGSQQWRDWGFPAGVLTGAFALAAIVFAVLTVGGGDRHPRVAAEPVATTQVPSGQLHGLLPDVPLATSSGQTVLAQSLRPALVALVPHRCRCAALVDDLAGRAAEVGVPVVVVAPGAQDADVAALPGQSHRGQVVAMFDPTAALANTYGAQGVTALVLAPDARVTFIMKNVHLGEHNLELALMAGIVAGGPSVEK